VYPTLENGYANDDETPIFGQIQSNYSPGGVARRQDRATDCSEASHSPNASYIPVRHGFLYLVAIMDFEAKRVIDNWIRFYNAERPHTALEK
jgi:hypothetical protein